MMGMLVYGALVVGAIALLAVVVVSVILVVQRRSRSKPPQTYAAEHSPQRRAPLGAPGQVPVPEPTESPDGAQPRDGEPHRRGFEPPA